MNFEQVHNNGSCLLLQCISGSKAYGLDTPDSDTDIKGVFVSPKSEFYSLIQTDQVSSEKNDMVYYELKRFFELLTKNNPAVLELLNSPPDTNVFRHPLMDKIKPELFLSKLCRQTFAGYAISQIKRARGLNKKMVNPVEKQKKSILEFCYVVESSGSISLLSWLDRRNYRQEDCGLVNIAHMHDIYALFHQSQAAGADFSGIFSGENAQEVLLSSIPKGIHPLAVMSFNKDGYSSYCKDYKEYWDWVESRNEVRYQSTVHHGKNYDAKNMMHTFRLLLMAEDIAVSGSVKVRQQNREFLLRIKSGAYSYEDLVKMAHEKIERINDQFDHSDLPDKPDEAAINRLLVEIRDEYYRSQN